MSHSFDSRCGIATNTLGQEQLSVVNSYLGVTISSDIEFVGMHKRVDSVSAKATRTLNFVRRNIYRCPPDVKTLAYTSLTRPHFEFASAALDPYIARDINQLDNVQHRAARFVQNDYGRTTSMSGLDRDLGWQSLHGQLQEERPLVCFLQRSSWPFCNCMRLISPPCS